MTPLAEILRDQIRRGGPIAFRRFMETALYHPEHGYYRHARDPFGKGGDYYTAEQIQPVYGKMVKAMLHRLGVQGTVVELGAGRGEMAETLATAFDYRAVDLGGAAAMPESFRGAVFTNEFFDALPVERVVWSDGAPRESLVGCQDDRFLWVTGDRPGAEIEDYLARYLDGGSERRSAEVNLDALRWLERIARSLASGWVLTVDYGYTRKESLRFLDGTLMSYRKHVASEDVLAGPGERDITAHVNFSALEEHGKRLGLEASLFATLGRVLLDVADVDAMSARERLQLKTLMFGMGETFRVLVQRRESPEDQ